MLTRNNTNNFNITAVSTAKYFLKANLLTHSYKRTVTRKVSVLVMQL